MTDSTSTTARATRHRGCRTELGRLAAEAAAFVSGGPMPDECDLRNTDYQRRAVRSMPAVYNRLVSVTRESPINRLADQLVPEIEIAMDRERRRVEERRSAKRRTPKSLTTYRKRRSPAGAVMHVSDDDDDSDLPLADSAAVRKTTSAPRRNFIDITHDDDDDDSASDSDSDDDSSTGSTDAASDLLRILSTPPKVEIPKQRPSVPASPLSAAPKQQAPVAAPPAPPAHAIPKRRVLAPAKANLDVPAAVKTPIPLTIKRSPPSKIRHVVVDDHVAFSDKRIAVIDPVVSVAVASSSAPVSPSPSSSLLASVSPSVAVASSSSAPASPSGHVAAAALLLASPLVPVHVSAPVSDVAMTPASVSVDTDLSVASLVQPMTGVDIAAASPSTSAATAPSAVDDCYDDDEDECKYDTASVPAPVRAPSAPKWSDRIYLDTTGCGNTADDAYVLKCINTLLDGICSNEFIKYTLIWNNSVIEVVTNRDKCIRFHVNKLTKEFLAAFMTDAPRMVYGKALNKTKTFSYYSRQTSVPPAPFSNNLVDAKTFGFSVLKPLLDSANEAKLYTVMTYLYMVGSKSVTVDEEYALAMNADIMTPFDVLDAQDILRCL